MRVLLCVSICTVINVLYRNYIWWEQMCRLIGVSSSPSSTPAPIPASHPYYLSWQYNQCFLPMLLNVFLLALIASFSLHCNSKWVWQITTIYLPRYTGFLCSLPPPPPHIGQASSPPPPLKVGESNLTKTHINFWAAERRTKSPGERGETLQNKSSWLVNHVTLIHQEN